eukprot:1677195-Pleurochrysis_carterae.AAC.1
MAPGAPTAEGAVIVDPKHLNPRPRTSARLRASHSHQVESQRYVCAVHLRRWVNVAVPGALKIKMRLQKLMKWVYEPMSMPPGLHNQPRIVAEIVTS